MLDNNWSQKYLAEKQKQPLEVIQNWESGHLTTSRRDLIDIYKLVEMEKTNDIQRNRNSRKFKNRFFDKKTDYYK